MSVLTLTVILSVTHANYLPFPSIRSNHFSPKAFVEVVAGDLHRRTQSVKWTKDSCTQWDSRLDLWVLIWPVLRITNLALVRSRITRRRFSSSSSWRMIATFGIDASGNSTSTQMHCCNFKTCSRMRVSAIFLPIGDNAIDTRSI